MTKKQFISEFAAFAKRAILFNNKKLRHGVKALEEEVEDLDDEYFKHGLRLVIDEVDPKIIDEILSNKLSFEKNKYRRRYMAIVKRTLLGIQEGLSSRILVFLLFSLANLPPKEQKKLEWELMKDPPDEPAEEMVQVDEEDIIAKYDFTSLRQWAMMVENIQYAAGQETLQGVLFSNRTIIITKDCPNPDRIIRIITGEGTKVESVDLDLDDTVAK